jgi:hypothetical protein
MRKLINFLPLLVFLLGSCSDSDDKAEDVYFEVNTDNILLKEEGGTAYINIASNVKWTVLVDNEYVPIADLEVTPLSGDGDGTIKITYGSEVNKTEREYANLIFYYYSEGERVSKSVVLTRNEKEEEEEWRTGVAILKYDYNHYSLMTSDGWKIKSDQSYFMGGTMYLVSYQYKDSMVDQEAKTMTVEFLSEPLCIDAPVRVGSIVDYPSNAPCYNIAYESNGPVFYDDYILIVPVFYWVHDGDDIKYHSLELVYDPSISGEVLKLHLRHNISNDEELRRDKYTIQYCAFDLQYVFSLSGKPNKIVIEYEKNSFNSNLESAQTTTYTLSYNK